MPNWRRRQNVNFEYLSRLKLQNLSDWRLFKLLRTNQNGSILRHFCNFLVPRPHKSNFSTIIRLLTTCKHPCLDNSIISMPKLTKKVTSKPSEALKSVPENAFRAVFHLNVPHKLHFYGIVRVHIIPRPPSSIQCSHLHAIIAKKNDLIGTLWNHLIHGNEN